MSLDVTGKTTYGPGRPAMPAGPLAQFRAAIVSRALPGPVAAVRNGVVRSSLLTVLLIMVDTVAVAGATIGMHFGWALLFGGAALVCRGRARLYRRRLRLSYVDDLPREFAALLVVLGATSGLAAVAGGVAVDALAMTGVTLTFAALVALPRLGVFQIARWARKRGRTDRTLVVGASAVSVDLVEKMIEHPEFGLRPVGFVDATAQLHRALPVPLLGHDMAAEIVRHSIGTVVLAFPESDPRDHVDAVMTAQRLGCTMFLVPRLYEVVHDAPDVERLRSYPMIRLSADPTTRPAWWVKRAIDLVLSTLALVLVAPVLAACALAVLVESGRPLIFKQERVGLDGRRFLIYKFRSLRPSDELEAATTWTVAGDPRIGPVGRFLRRTSLDELPQLWNILRGEMSLVGPRPERPGFVQQFAATHQRYWARHRVPSGLTGLAQISGLRGNSSIGDRASFDNYYIANWSLWLDIKILVLTVRELVRRGDH
jgi:exopolysaccharide biosynthesis polyprenyl glycosylphosphotransferase